MAKKNIDTMNKEIRFFHYSDRRSDSSNSGGSDGREKWNNNDLTTHLL